MQIQPNRVSPLSAFSAVRPAGPTMPGKAPAQSDMAAPAAMDVPDGERMSKGDRMSGLARFDGFREALMHRVQNAAGDMPGDAKSFEEAAAYIDHGMERLRNGFADGTIDSAGIARGLKHLFAGATDIMAAAQPTGERDQDMAVPAGWEAPADATEPRKEPTGSGVPMGADAMADAAVKLAMDGKTSVDADMEAPMEPDEGGLSAMATAVRERLMGFADHVSARVEGANYPDDERRATADATNALFESAVARLDAAVFNPVTGDPIDRDGLPRLFSAMFEQLQGQITSLLGETPTGATLYGANQRVDQANPTAARVDLAG